MTPLDHWQFLTAEDITALHDAGIRQYGGTPGILDPNCPDAKIAATKNALLYEGEDEEGMDLLRAAAYLIVYVAKGHCYADGNKRAAWFAALRLLDLNGIRMGGDDPEAAPLVDRVAAGTADVNEVTTWLARPERFREGPTEAEAAPTAKNVSSRPPPADAPAAG